MSRASRLLVGLLVAAALLLALTACGAQPTRVDTRTTTNTVSVPSPVKCFNQDDIPSLPPRTVVDTNKATTDQLAAATAADAEAYEAYARAAAQMWDQCTKGAPK